MVRISGIIDETFNTEELVAGATGIMVIDLQGVRRITSFGIRGWINALQKLHVDYACLINCPPTIVVQLNMVTGFAGHAEVISFKAPYVCGRCEHTTELVMDLRRADHQQLVAAMQLPALTCPMCQSEAEFDDVPEIYLQYFRAAPTPNPPALANALIDGREVGQSFSIEKQIAKDVTAFWMWGSADRPQYFRRLSDGLQGDVVVVSSDVEAVSSQAFKALAAFLRNSEANVYVARMPAGLVGQFADWRDKIGNTKVVSVMLPFYCSHCARDVRIEVPGPILTQSNGFSSFTGHCPDCSHKAQPRITGDILAKSQKLPLVSAPETIREYLADRPNSPTPDGRLVTDETVDNPLSKYRIEKYLGSGGMGDVYQARQIGPAGFEKVVVIKRIRSDRLADREAVEMFLQEARLTARLSHPNIVQIFDFGKMDGSYFLTMEYVDGPDLRSIFNACRQLLIDVPIELGCRIISDLCRGLHAAHVHKNEAGEVEPIIHRDVTPGNVLISSAGMVKLTDFGIAKLHDSEADTQPELIKGTVRFIAPEMLTSPRFSAAGPTVDVYGTGVLLFECLAGRPLFAGQGWASTLNAILEQPIPKLGKHRIGISPHLERTFQRAVERNPNKRFQTIRELQKNIDRAIDELKRPASNQHLADWLQEVLVRREHANAEAGEIDTMNDLGHDATAVGLLSDVDSTDPNIKA